MNHLQDKTNLSNLLLKIGVNKASVDKYCFLLSDRFKTNNFDDEIVICFLSNVMTETGSLSKVSENLNYSAKRICQVWPSLFKTELEAAPYANNQEKLANYVYNSNVNKRVISLNNFNTGDGFKYKGRGFLQTTGKSNYQLLKDITGIDFINYPELLEKPEYAVDAAIIFWTYNKISNKPSLKEMRKVIAGSYFGYDDYVLPYYNKLKAAYKSLF